MDTMAKNLLTGTLLVLLSACATVPKDNVQPTPKDALAHIKATLSQGSVLKMEPVATEKNTSGLPQAVKDALLPAYNVGMPAANHASIIDRFDVSVSQVSAREFFMGLVKGTTINMVMHPDVSGRISLDLKRVTIEEVLEVAREIYGYEYSKNSTGYMILPSRLQSKIFHVNYLNIVRNGESNTRVTSGQISTNSSGGQNSQGSQGNGVSNSGGNQGAEAFSSSLISTKTSSDFWINLESTIATILGSKDGRSVVVSPQSGLVVVRAMTPELRDVEKFLMSAQLSMHRQVILEAKIIEVELSKQNQSGINWAALGSSNGNPIFTSNLSLIDGVPDALNETGKVDKEALSGNDLINKLGGLFAVGFKKDNFAAIIRLLNTQGTVNVLSSPRVSTVNNQKAVIKVGTDEFFVTEVSSNTVISAGGATGGPQVTLTPFFSGIALDVTPQINEHNEVILHIHPTVSQVRDQTKEITVAGQKQTLPLAFSTVRESDSIVKARDGQIVVIGGLMQNSSADTTAGLTGLKDIPLLGHLFKNKDKTSRRSELVILLKPIMDTGDSSIWNQDMSDVSERIQSFTK